MSSRPARRPSAVRVTPEPMAVTSVREPSPVATTALVRLTSLSQVSPSARSAGAEAAGEAVGEGTSAPEPGLPTAQTTATRATTRATSIEAAPSTNCFTRHILPCVADADVSVCVSHTRRAVGCM